MSNKVFCCKYQKDLDGLDKPPYPGPKGLWVYENVSKQAWAEWLQHQTMLINEKKLNMMDADARKYLLAQMDKFMSNEAYDRADGYVPPSSTEKK